MANFPQAKAMQDLQNRINGLNKAIKRATRKTIGKNITEFDKIMHETNDIHKKQLDWCKQHETRFKVECGILRNVIKKTDHLHQLERRAILDPTQKNVSQMIRQANLYQTFLEHQVDLIIQRLEELHNGLTTSVKSNLKKQMRKDLSDYVRDTIIAWTAFREELRKSTSTRKPRKK